MAPHALLAAASPHPVRGQPLHLLLRRDAPLSTGEHRAIAELAVQAGRRRWSALEALEILALDGPGDAVACLRARLGEPDLALQELPELARLGDRLRRILPTARMAAHDPVHLLGLHEGALTVRGSTVEAAGGIGALRGPWTPEPGCVLRPPADLPAPGSPSAWPAPRTEGELADLLQAIARRGARAPLLRAGAGPGVVHLDRLTSLLHSGVLPGAACALLVELARRDLVDLDGVDDAVEQLLLDGDAAERAAARALLLELRRASNAEHTASWAAPGQPAADWSTVAQIGADLLARPSLEVADDGEAEDWEDDLLGDDLLLLDPDAEVPESPVSQAIRFVDPAGDALRCRALVDQADFAARAAAHLRGDDALAAGACVLLLLGCWPADALPGVVHLVRDVCADDRPWPVRALAATTLASFGRADAVPALVGLMGDPDLRVARAAVRGLGQVAGAEAREAARGALRDDRLAAHAVAAAGDASDFCAFVDAVALSGHEDPDVRRAVARHLDRIGGRRAIPALRTLQRSDDSWQVQLEAAGGLAHHAPLPELRELLRTDDADVSARVMRALGEADRGDAFSLLEQGARHVRATVREAAARALGALALPAGTEPLLGLLQDANPDVRVAAVDALSTCGDRRAAHPLRRQASLDDPTGAAARRVLKTGYRLRLPPPDSRVRIRAVTEDTLTDAHRQVVLEHLDAPGIAIRFTEQGFDASGSLDPRDVSALAALARALNTLEQSLPPVRWSARDGQYALRRAAEGWVVSGVRGELPRDAGWFDEALPAPAERAPLTALTGGPSGVSPLPVAVMQHVRGREQVRIAPPADVGSTPDEITGEVFGARNPGPQVETGAETDTVDDAATEGASSGGGSPRPLPRPASKAWDDLLSEQRAPDVLADLARRGLSDSEREQLRTWLGSGLPGIQVAACRVVQATADATALGPVAALSDHQDPGVRLAVVGALGALSRRDPAAGEVLQALAEDPHPPVAEAAERALLSASTASGEE